MCRLKSDSLHIGVQIKFFDKFSYAASEVTRSFLHMLHCLVLYCFQSLIKNTPSNTMI